jgi:hypothetical protein
MTDCIAERQVRYRTLDGKETGELLVRVYAPFLLQEGDANFVFSLGTAGCKVCIEGFAELLEETTYGADSVQALELAVVGIGPRLRRLSKIYALSFPTGEPYFEE